MGRHRSKEKRIRQVSEAALQSEIQRNAEKIPDIIPDSALFAEDDATPEKKKKIFLHPRPSQPPKPKTAEEEYEDLWAASKEIPKDHPKPRPKPKTQKSYPTSNMAYNSAAVVKPPPPPEPESDDDDEQPVPQVPADETETGFGDTLAGDEAPKIDVSAKPPEPVKMLKKDVEINQKITKRMPDEQKMEMYRANREARKILKEREEAERIPEFEKTKEYSEEIQKRNDEIAARPKKEKEDKLMRFIADEPDFQVHEQPKTLTEAPADSRPFARLQRKFEVERKVGLHESNI